MGDMGIGLKIKQFRIAKKITQKTLAEKIGMSQQQLGLYEKGNRTPKADTLKAIADALDVPVDRLYQSNEYPIDDVPQDDGPVYQSSAWEDFFDAFINFGNSLPDGYSVHAGADVGRVFLTYPDGDSSKEVSVGDLYSVVKKAQDYMRYELDQFRKGKT